MKKYFSKTLLNQSVKPVTPVECGYEMCKPLHSYGPAIRSFYLLHFVVSGKGVFKTEGSYKHLSENDIFIIRPYEVTYYEADENEPWTYIWIGFESEYPLPSTITERDVISAPFLRSIFESMIGEEYFSTENVDIACETYLSGLIMQLFGLMLRNEVSSEGSNDNYINRAISMIENNYCNDITVTEIAKALHLNRSYFTEMFKSKVGRSPHSYLTEYRMKKAVNFLAEKGLAVSVTARSVGYPDVFAFSRAFKNYYGITPTEYIRKNRVL